MLTGFRDEILSDYITSNGGTIQSGINMSTDFLIVKNLTTKNNKVTFAKENGIKIITPDELMSWK